MSIQLHGSGAGACILRVGAVIQIISGTLLWMPRERPL